MYMKKLFMLVLLCSCGHLSIQAQDAVALADRFVKTLTPEQSLNTVFPFDSEERYNFHFVPLARKGITFNEMNAAQRSAAMALLRSCVSESTFQKIEAIRQLEDLLKEIEKRPADDHYRDTGNHHFSIFGIPANNTIWGWRFEGHHMSFNFSFDKKQLISGTPAFLGSNPGRVLAGAWKDKEVLKEETEEGAALLVSLSAEQRTKAITAVKAPADILSFDKRKADLGTPKGISYAEMNPAAQQQLLQLVKVYVNRFTRLFATDMLKEITAAGLEHLYFCWEGDTEPGVGHPHYYRVQGPTLLIEYDNTQNNANHVHSVLRDLKHDFGGDLLLEHYNAEHKK
jgi:hypothetical protein